MKITFICGSLEPGKDGVGDYTRRLAGELIRIGHEVSVVSINDQYICNVFRESQFDGENEVVVYRISSKLKSSERFALAKSWINKFDPDWISVQFVAFSYQRKGLSIGLGKNLRNLAMDKKWHIMFHELWVGAGTKSPKKHIVWGKLQRFLIQAMVANLMPDVIHTQSRLYQLQLNKLGFNTAYLPLFGNIPINVPSFNKLNNDTRSLNLIIFGTIHPDAPVKPFVEELALYANEMNKDIVLRIVGRCGRELEYWKSVFTSAGIRVLVFGEQTVEQISEFLSISDLGIATGAFCMIEKSGTVAAMREHGLPVICVSRDWEPRGIEAPRPPVDIKKYQIGNLRSILFRSESDSCNTVSEVTKELLMHIQKK